MLKLTKKGKLLVHNLCKNLEFKRVLDFIQLDTTSVMRQDGRMVTCLKYKVR